MEGSVITMLQMQPKPDLRPQGLRTLDHLDHTSAATKRKNNILKLWCNTQNIKITILIIFRIQLCGVRYSLTILTDTGPAVYLQTLWSFPTAALCSRHQSEGSTS